jgi:hypothetical protein
MAIAKQTIVTRDAILNLLTEAEVAKVSTAEGLVALAEGEDYVDLERLDLGVQRAKHDVKIAMENVVPRSAVGQSNWSKISTSFSR